MSATRSIRQSVVTIALFAVVCLGIFLVIFRAGGGELPGSGGYRFQAVVPDAVALAPGSKVRSAGVVIGTVTEVAHHAGNAVVMARLDEDHAPVYRDARVQVRLKSLVGENYLDVARGTPAAGALALGGVLPLANADDTTQLDQILTVLDAPGRRRLRTLIASFGGGLQGHGADLNRSLGALGAASDAGRDVTTILAQERRQVAGLIDDLGSVMRAVADRGGALAQFAEGARSTAEAVAARDRDLGRTLQALPGTLAQARRSAGTLGALSVQATPVVARLAVTLRRLAPVLDALPSATRRTRRTLAALSAFSAPGGPLLRRLASFAGRASGPLAGGLDATLAQTVPMVGYLAPYSREAGAFFSNLRSATSYRDATGNLARAHAIVNEGSLAISTPFEQKVVDELFKLGGLGRARRLGNNQYPKPGEMAAPRAFKGSFDRVTALPTLLTTPPPSQRRDARHTAAAVRAR